jgi:lipoprotein-anchoring transpeptidase ErfK/SrfK
VKRVRVGLLIVGLALAGALAASVLAGTPGASSEKKPRPGAEPLLEPEPARLPSSVKIGGIHVGGLTPKAAYTVVRLSFRPSLVLKLDKARLSVAPSRLGATAYVKGAVSRALQARPGTSVPLHVSVRGADVRAYVDSLARRYERKAKDARLFLNDLRPHVVEESPGKALSHDLAVAAIVRALRENRRAPVRIPTHVVRPKVLKSNFGSVVVIRRESKLLYLYRGEDFVQRFPVATGQAVYPTPIGRFEIITKWANPWWYPPDSEWAQGLRPIPPGPGNPLGTRWMGISSPGVGIHGTPDAASLGYSASHGCIRMYIPSAEWLFERVELGTPVFIVPV